MNNNFRVFISTFNLLLIIVGYQFVTTFLSFLISDTEGASQLVTVPYRAFAFFVTLLTILMNIKNRYKLHSTVIVLLIYWALLLLRFFYDMYFRSDVFVNSDLVSKILLYMIPITIVPIYSILKSYKYIDFHKLFNWTVILYFLSIIFSFVSNQDFQIAAEDRISTAAQSTIDVGHFGLKVFILSVFVFLNRQTKYWQSFFLILIILISILVLFRAGSKGPFLAALGVFVVWILGLSKSVYKSLFFLFASVLIGYLMFDFFTEFMKNISPILYERVFETDDLLSEGDILYHYALDVFYRNPLTGGSFGIYLNPGESIYAHNILLDSLMQMGLIGGVMLLYILISVVKRIIQVIYLKENYYWIALLLMQTVMLLMVSSSVYYEPVFSIFIVLLFMPICNENYSLNETGHSGDQLDVYIDHNKIINKRIR